MTINVIKLQKILSNYKREGFTVWDYIFTENR